LTQKKFPGNEIIERYKKAGYILTVVGAGNNVWSLVFSFGTEYTYTRCLLQNELSQKKLNNYFSSESFVLSLCY
jgi:hypothetical protein